MNKRRLHSIILSIIMFITFSPLVFSNNMKDTIDTEISINKSNITLNEIFNILKNKTGYSFNYGEYILKNKEKYNLNYNKAQLTFILDDLGQKAKFSYKITNNIVVIGKIQKKEMPNAQNQINIKGVVKDNTGETLPGVTVVIKGTTKGTITNINGEYSIDNVPIGAILKFSFVGMKPQEFTVGSQSTINVTMNPEFIGLDDVVVVGYGVQKKSVVTGAISSVKAEDLINYPVADPSQAIEGKVSGVTITQNSGAPGSAMSIRIRGTGTSGYNEPLYIVDGVQMGGLNSINPADIESIEILKDAASGAIYGARAANGVVLVTTKKGKEGKVSVNYNGYYGVQNPWKKLNLPNAYQYMRLFNEGMENDKMQPKFPVGEILLNEYDTDWQNEIFVKNAPITNHHFQVTGGSKVSSFVLSAGYFSQDGIIGGSKASYDKYSFRLNSEHKVSKHFKVGENISYYTSKSSGVANQHGVIGLLSSAVLMEPNLPVHATDEGTIKKYDNYPVSPVRDPATGQYYHLSEYGRNPLAWLETTYNEGIDNALTGDFYIEVPDIVKDLKFKSDFGFYRGNGGGRGYSPKAYFGPADKTSVSSVNQSSSSAFTWQWENTLSYIKSIGANNFTALIGNTINMAKGSYMSGSRTNLIPDGWHYAWLNNGANDPSQNTGGGYWENRLVSFFGRVDYNYAEKYLITATMRADGSSRFGPENKFGYFPSFSAGWVLSKEPFLKNVEFLSQLKLRASWGQVGNDAIGNFAYLSSMVKGYSYTLGNGTNMAQSIIPGMASNPALKWETSEQTNIGVDMGFFRYRLMFTLEYYKKNTKDLLATEPIPMYVGLWSPIANVGEISNQGIEMSMTFKQGENNFHYSATFMASYNKNEVIKVGNADGYINGSVIDKQISGQLRMQEGEVFPFFYGYKTDGIFQTQEEVDNYTDYNGQVIQPDALPGDIRFVDINKDGKIDENDRTNIGAASPDWNFGLNMSADYKNFDLSMMFQGQLGNQIANVTFIDARNYSTRSNNAYKRWHGEGTTNSYPRATMNDLNRNYASLNDMVHIEDGSFLRLKNIQLGYSIPKRLLQKVSISNFRVYVTAHNLWTFTNYTGFDPEIGSGNTGGFLDFGIDRAAYPQARSFLTGINVTF